jgi:hypothetical protein
MHIGVSYLDRFEPEPFAEFVRAVETPTLHLQLEAREPEGFRAGLQWLLPTAAVVFIAKSYFDSFLKEMGKDHYKILKSAIKTLAGKILGRCGPKITVVGTTGKVLNDDPYSFAFSVLVDIGEGRRAKLLFKRGIDPEYISLAVDAFTDLVRGLQDAGPNSVGSRLTEEAKWASRTLLFAYDTDSGALKMLDPVKKAQQTAAQRTGSSSASASR